MPGDEPDETRRMNAHDCDGAMGNRDMKTVLSKFLVHTHKEINSQKNSREP